MKEHVASKKRKSNHRDIETKGKGGGGNKQQSDEIAEELTLRNAITKFFLSFVH